MNVKGNKFTKYTRIRGDSMIVLLSIILALIFAFLATMPFLFINTRLHENVNHSKEEIRHEKIRAIKRFVYFFILIIILLMVFHFITN